MSQYNNHTGGHHNTSHTHGKYQSESELNNALMIAVGGFLLYILLGILIRWLAIASPYMFYPIAMPVYSFSSSGISAGIIVSIYALFGVIVAFAYKGIKGKLHIGSLIYAVFWLIVAGMEFAFWREKNGVPFSPLTAHISYFCLPVTSDGEAVNDLLYPLFCSQTIDGLANFPATYIMLTCLIPNLAYGLFGLNVIIANFIKQPKHPKSKIKARIPDVNALINVVAPHQPHLLIYQTIDPNQWPFHSGPLRLMDSPRRYAFEHDLIKNFVKRPKQFTADHYKKPDGKSQNEQELSFTETPEDDYVPQIDIEKFEKIMTLQLGDVFTDIDSLSPTQTVIMSLSLSLACRADLNMDKDEAKKILKEVSSECDEIAKWASIDLKTAHKEDLGFSRFPNIEKHRETLRKWYDHEIAQKIFSSHAYTNTIILRCLAEAKKMGVFQPSSLRWLMFYDRNLWAVVQNEGRPSVFAENAGSTSHYLVELKVKRKIYLPMLQIAYEGFMENIRNYSYSHDKVQAWQKFKETGDPTEMIKKKLVSEDFKYGK